MNILGRHLSVDMYGCSQDILDNPEFIKSTMLKAIEETAMTLLDFSFHKKEPRGLTAFSILTEGHMSIHTYPDLGYAAIDIFTCTAQSSPDRAILIMRNQLKPEKIKTTTIRRGDFGQESDMKPKVKVRIAPFKRVKNTGAKVLSFLSRSK